MKSKRSKARLVERAKRNRFKRKRLVCEFEGCSAVYLKAYPRQRYCTKECSHRAHLAQQAEWRARNREKVNRWKLDWIHAHIELRRARQRDAYYRNRTTRLLKQRIIDQNRRQRIRQERALLKNGTPMNVYTGQPFFKDADSGNMPLRRRLSP